MVVGGLVVKPVIVALASASLIAAPLSAAAQRGGGSGGHGGWSGGGHGGGGGGGGAWRGGGWGGWHGGGHGGWYGGWHGHNYGCWGCYYGSFAFGLALGAAWYPWYWDAPYYGYPYGYTVVYPDGGYYYDRYQRDYGPPPPTYAAPAQPACGTWLWDGQRQQYNWMPCAVAPPP
jgi:hypothetical protein